MSYRHGSGRQYAQKRVQSVVAAKLKKAQIKTKPLIRARQQPLLGPKIKVIKTSDFVNPGASPVSSAGDLLKDSRGFYANFKSKSDPSKPPYQARIWTVNEGRFKRGDVSCNCPGWVFNHRCHHTKDVENLFVKYNGPTLWRDLQAGRA